jgi:hypothetical protein
MQKKRHLSSLFVGLALLCMAHGASAIGWSRAQQSAVLGQQLDFSAALRLDPGDNVAPECVVAEVMLGDTRLPASAVRLVIDTHSPDTLGIRVLSTTAVDEPVVAVTLAIGCPARMSRRFVLLADPPSLVAAANVPNVVSVAAAPPPPPADALASRPAAPAPHPSAATRSATRADAPPPPPRHVAAAKKPRRAVVASTPKAAEPVARLRLDPAEPALQPAPAASAVEDAIEAVAQAASAARAAASAASAAEQRIATLERNITEMRAEAQANRDLVAQMRERLGAAEGGGRWLLPLLLAVLALAALAAWLGWRLRVLQRERQAAWRRAAAAEAAPRHAAMPTSQLPMVTSELPMPTTPVPVQRVAPWPTVVPRGPTTVAMPAVARPRPPVQPAPPTPPAPRPEVPVGAHERTLVLPPQALPEDDGSPRDVSIEELLDLEQQAEFFIVLGQDDAAIDLLVDHLRNTGGGSPLPYLKLLEIYRRRNEREAYERTRTRFNHRFNAYAPDWDADLQHGRALEDYVGVLPRLQQVWPRPLDAMAELEALLFRKSRGELFELPAYREVLFLYSLARDLLDREAADTGNVDLLLPLADGGEFSATSPHPYFGLERDSVFDMQTEDRPTSPVDLDLTQPDTQPMIVVEKPPRR